MVVIWFKVRVPVLSEQMWVAPPMVSAEASFLTRLFIFLILAEEKLREMVTARGSPSGIATTTIVIAIIMVPSKSVQSLFSLVNPNERGTHPSTSTQLNMFPHPHGTHPASSIMILIMEATTVSLAQAIPTPPILSAIVSSLRWRRVG